MGVPRRPAAGGRRGVVLCACLLAACPAAAAPFSVVGASGAMHVTFSVSPTKIHVGEYPWYRIELKNAGKKDLVFSDKLFEDPWQPVIDRSSTLGFVLKVEGPDGKPLFATPRRTIRDPRLQEKRPEPPNPEELRKDRENVARWRKEGLSDEQIRERLNDPMKSPIPKPNIHAIKPGGSLATTPWHYLNPERQAARWEPPAGLEEFRELAIFEFDKPGRYRIRLLYDHDPKKRLQERQSELESDIKNSKGDRARLSEYLLRSLRERAANPGPLNVALPAMTIDLEVSP